MRWSGLWVRCITNTETKSVLELYALGLLVFKPSSPIDAVFSLTRSLVDTAIVPIQVKVLMAGIPLTPVSRIGAAIFSAATDTDPLTNGAVWTLPDDGPVLRIDRAQLRLNQGVYKLINDRIEAITRYFSTCLFIVLSS